MTTLRLGITDKIAVPADKKSFFAAFHYHLAAALQKKLCFRDEKHNEWRPIVPTLGTQVADFQQFLKDAGFLPESEVDGIFGYVTQAAARLFQEYIRTIEGDESIGKPDGIIGAKTREHIQRWKTAGLKCEWANFNSDNSTLEFNQWLGLLENAKKHYLNNPSEILKMVDIYPFTGDTIKLANWTFDRKECHLIGIRRDHDLTSGNRQNDDLFILLLNGMIFKFWGSADPNPFMAHKNRFDEAYLVEGQHLYQFGWHKVGSKSRVYRALKPATDGVLVFRDKTGKNALTQENIAKGLSGPNNSINIHWSGGGSFNFSAGCQVISGNSYINHKNEVVNCRSFSARSYAGLDLGKTRGAYNVLADLVLVYTPKGTKHLRYTLGRASTMELSADFEPDFAKKTLRQLKDKTI